jgi:hypothetical protein
VTCDIPVQGITIVEEAIPASSSRVLSATFKDVDGAALTSSAQVQSIKLTLWDELSNAIINGRNAIDVKNDNGGTLDEAGNFSFDLTPNDTRAFGVANLQPRRLWLDVQFDATRRENHLVYFKIIRLEGVTP